MTCWGFSVLSLWQESGLWINKLNPQPLKLDHCSCSSLSNNTRESCSRPRPSVNINCPRHLHWLFTLFTLKPRCTRDNHLSRATHCLFWKSCFLINNTSRTRWSECCWCPADSLWTVINKLQRKATNLKMFAGKNYQWIDTYFWSTLLYL